MAAQSYLNAPAYAAAKAEQQLDKLEAKLVDYYSRLIKSSNKVASGNLHNQVNRILDEFAPKSGCTAYVLQDDEVNAYCLPNKEIFLTTGLLNALENRDQLEFILGHELSHIRKSGKIVRETESLPEYLHRARFDEYAGDVEGFLEANKTGNPMEGIKILQKIASGSYGGAVHGDTTHRVLNLFWVTKLRDLEGIQREPRKLELDYSGTTYSDAPNMKVFRKLDGSAATYRNQIERCEGLLPTLAVYEAVSHAAKDELNPIEQDNLQTIRESLFDRLTEHAEPALAKLGIENTVQNRYNLAEIVKVMCGGDNRAALPLSAQMIGMIMPATFQALDLVPIYVKQEYIDDYLVMVTGQMRREKKKGIEKLVKSFFSNAKKVGVELNLRISGLFFANGEGFDKEYEKIFAYDHIKGEKTGIAFTNKFKSSLEKMSKQQMIAALRRAQRFHEAVENDHFYSVLIDDLPIYPSNFQSKDPVLDWLEVIIPFLGSDEAYESRNFSEVYNTYFSDFNDNIKCPDISTFERAVSIIKDADDHGRDILSRGQRDYFIEQFRMKLLHDVLEKKDYRKAAKLVEESLRIHPISEYFDMEYIWGIEKFDRLPDDIYIQTYLSFLLPPIDAGKRQAALIPRFLRDVSVRDALAFLSDNLSALRSAAPLEYVFEQKPKTNEELSECLQMPGRISQALGREGQQDIAGLVLVELLNKHAQADRLDLIKALLDHESDLKLKRYMYETLIDAILHSDDAKEIYLTSHMSIDEIDKWYEKKEEEREDGTRKVIAWDMLWQSCRLNDKDNYWHKGRYSSGVFTLVLSSTNETDATNSMSVAPFYDLDVAQKYAIIRMLLADAKHGVLQSPKYKKRVAKEVLEELVSAENEHDRKALGIIEDVFSLYMQAAPMQQTYFTLMPLLLEHCFIKPESRTANKRVIVESWLDRWHKDFVSSWSTDKIAEFKETFYASVKELPKIEDKENYDTANAVAADLSRRYGLESEAALYLKGIVRYSTSFSAEETQASAEKVAAKKMNVIDFIQAAARNLGSPGIRFLQLIGQFTDIPEEYAASFSKVYDDLRGQSKVSAYHTIIRELPTFKDRFTGLDEAIGGGSINTVYSTHTHDGRKKVVKVLNPNASYMNEMSLGILKEVLDDLANTKSEYRLGREILDDIAEWIKRDIEQPNTAEQESEFRKANHGFKGVDGYQMMVPELEFSNRFVKIEDYVEGTNMTRTRQLAEQGHDIKAITATLAKNYLYQMAHGLVHSDVHPGNFRITEDKKIAILDRNYYLQFTEEQKEKFAALVTSAMQSDVIGFTQSLSSVVNMNGHSLNEQDVAGIFEQRGDLTDKVLTTMKQIRSRGAKVPIELTLLLRNVHSLNKFAQDAGFSGLEEAISYSGAAA